MGCRICHALSCPEPFQLLHNYVILNIWLLGNKICVSIVIYFMLFPYALTHTLTTFRNYNKNSNNVHIQYNLDFLFI